MRLQQLLLVIGSAVLMAACGADAAKPVDTTSQPLKVLEAPEVDRSSPKPVAASAQQVMQMEEEIRLQRVAIAERAAKTDRPLLLKKIKELPDGPERERLVDDYVVAVHYLDGEKAASALAELRGVLGIK